MPETIDANAMETPSSAATPPTIALALSGGGFRAAIFHLGACRRLHELGILQRVETISSVSGGSIFSAFLAERMIRAGRGKGAEFEDYDRELAEPFRSFVGINLRPVPGVLHFVLNFFYSDATVGLLERQLKKHVSENKLIDLPTVPEFVFCATDLTFAVNWTFKKTESGDYLAGYLERAHNWPIARAVAASSCFPPMFGPMQIRGCGADFAGARYTGDDLLALQEHIQLCDGGLYDNMGLEPVFKDPANRVVLVSNGGAKIEYGSSRRPFKTLLRYEKVATVQIKKLRKRLLYQHAAQDEAKAVALWDIAEGNATYSQSLAQSVIARIRTDLDPFSEAEFEVLENQGYASVDPALAKECDALLPEGVPPARIPHQHWLDEAAVREALRFSHQRRVRRWFSRRAIWS